MSESVYRSAPPGEGGDAPSGESAKTLYRVVFEGLKPNETLGSFSIKYGILTSTPVTKIKLMLRNLPKTVLETKNRVNARGTLELIEEAGGVGKIENYDLEEAPRIEVPEAAPAKAAAGEIACPKCGFPLGGDDVFCQFCNTPLVETKSYKFITVLKAGGHGHLVSPKRLMIYIVILLLALLWGALSS